MFKKGDLIEFNDRGIALFKYVAGYIAVIYSDPILLYEYDNSMYPEQRQYYGYDILVCGQLFKDIPEEFLKRIATKNEKNIK